MKGRNFFSSLLSSFCFLFLAGLVSCENLKNDNTKPEDVVIDNKAAANDILLEEWQSLRVKDFLTHQQDLVVLCLGDVSDMPKDLDQQKKVFAPLFLFPGSRLQVKFESQTSPDNPVIHLVSCREGHPVNLNPILSLISPMVLQSSLESAEVDIFFQGDTRRPVQNFNLGCRSIDKNPLEGRDEKSETNILLDVESKMIYQHRARPVKRTDPKKFLRMVVCTP